jgi:hypothetical protein
MNFNGLTVFNDCNIKLNKTNMKKIYTQTCLLLTMALFGLNTSAQTNVFDDIIATSPNHNFLEAALLFSSTGAAVPFDCW